MYVLRTCAFLRYSSPLSWGLFNYVHFSFIMTAKFIVEYRYYAYDDGHSHWTDDYQSFDTNDEAQQFISELDRRIASGDNDVRPGRIVDEDDMPSWDSPRDTPNLLF